jgi:hypothetical protein
VAAKQQTETTGNCLITSGLMNGVQAGLSFLALLWQSLVNFPAPLECSIHFTMARTQATGAK